MKEDERLGPYRLLRRLGEGGMGVVHLALDPYGRQVALKVLRSEVAGDDVARRRLSREVETMRRVRSEYIAEVLDADVTGHRPYIVTRYVPGPSLDKIVKEEGPLPLDALLRVAHGVAEALAAVHAAGVVHRDLKPGNVLMVDGRPVLIDFGIAQAVDATRLTQTGMFIGTPGYLAPEIIQGGEAGPEVDIHAWAGTILFAATGEPPFGTGTLEMIFYNITSGRANIDAAPPILQPVLRAAFNRDPKKRPTAAELAQWVARLRSPSGAPRRPDMITTVPNLGEAGGGPAAPDTGARTRLAVTSPSAPGTAAPPAGAAAAQTGMAAPPQAGTAAMPQTGMSAVPAPPSVRPPADRPAAPGTGDATTGPGDPFPTVRVTGDDLRRASAPPAEGQRTAPGARTAPAAHSRPVTPQPPAHPPHTPPSHPGPGLAEGDIPTRRVTSAELRQAGAYPYADRGRPAGGLPPREPHGPEVDPTLRLRPSELPDTAPPPPFPTPRPAPAGGRVYRAGAALTFAALGLLAVLMPKPALLITLPAVVLLRAADIAHRRLAAGHPAGSAGVLRVLADPAALIRSALVTIALIPYGALLGTAVTLLLNSLVTAMHPSAAVSWGFAVALWTVCAGPGVRAPTGQLERTLAALVPDGGTAKGVVLGIGAVTALFAALTLGTFTGKETSGHFAPPFNVQSVIDRLKELRDQAETGGRHVGY